jgi:ribosomal protein L7/L12
VGACPYCKKVYPDAVGTAAAAPRAQGIPAGVLEAIDAGNLIEAIRLHRAANKSSLLEAKTAVEGIAKWRRQGR